MFTGIVQAACLVEELVRKPGLLSLGIRLPPHLVEGLVIGASVALDGVCMTVTAVEGTLARFDAMQETLGLSTLGRLARGDRVNVERSFTQGMEIGGHIVSGHVDGMASVERCEASENNLTVYYRLPPGLAKYVLRKGFVAVNGCSLTVADVDRVAEVFSVCYIPETLRVTTHGDKQPGDRVNIEVDRQTQAIVDTVERLFRENPELLRPGAPG